MRYELRLMIPLEEMKSFNAAYRKAKNLQEVWILLQPYITIEKVEEVPA